MSQSGPTNPSLLGFDGQQYDAATGLYYQRYYDASIGSFISQDPAEVGTDWYEFANNNPLMYNDPTGLCPRTFVDTTQSIESLPDFSTNSFYGGTSSSSSFDDFLDHSSNFTLSLNGGGIVHRTPGRLFRSSHKYRSWQNNYERPNN